ncbi:MAG: hypothetical protein V3W18_07225 [candidate division Zixibacteria bacterium]
MNRIVILIFAFVSLAGHARGTQFINTEDKNTVIKEDYNDDVFIAGNQIRFDGKVRGDLYAACNEFVTADSIAGNLNVACKTVESLEPIGRSFIGFAQEINLNAPIGRNALAFAQKIVIGPETSIGANANLYGETVIFRGRVIKDLVIESNSAVISGEIGGDFHFEGDDLSISPEALIKGDLIYCSPEKGEIVDPDIIAGEIKWTQCVVEDEEDSSFISAFTWLISHRGYFLSLSFFSLVFFIFSVIPLPGLLAMIFLWIGLFISGNLFIMASKELCRKTENVLGAKTFPSIGLGFAILFLSPVGILILLLSIFGAPLGAVGILAFGIACFAGGVYASLFIGRLICRLMNIGSGKSTGYGCYTLGMIILVALSFLPVLGYLISLVIIMMGIGGLALALYGRAENSALPDTVS